eukprot:CAMPEP_0119121502 /NCGR_PEP_ID=MMETSP1310-20130426/2102_1 /TAXON_ID=464262 /ORGANISM="Genus nov. species nov., Strain RCC2339" /LENGTH=542 /DNA_ID=CAMNT_0007111069 /DNA_START=254 /DNA_END=1879 /DNA_ORIENTATION=+
MADKGKGNGGGGDEYDDLVQNAYENSVLRGKLEGKLRDDTVSPVAMMKELAGWSVDDPHFGRGEWLRILQAYSVPMLVGKEEDEGAGEGGSEMLSSIFNIAGSVAAVNTRLEAAVRGSETSEEVSHLLQMQRRSTKQLGCAIFLAMLSARRGAPPPVAAAAGATSHPAAKRGGAGVRAPPPGRGLNAPPQRVVVSAPSAPHPPGVTVVAADSDRRAVEQTAAELKGLKVTSEARPPSIGVVCWVRDGSEWACLMQVSLSTYQLDLKVDPIRGKRAGEERREETASRELLEETASLLSLPPRVIQRNSYVYNKLYHIRLAPHTNASTALDEFGPSLLSYYHSNRQSILDYVDTHPSNSSKFLAQTGRPYAEELLSLVFLKPSDAPMQQVRFTKQAASVLSFARSSNGKAMLSRLPETPVVMNWKEEKLEGGGILRLGVLEGLPDEEGGEAHFCGGRDPVTTEGFIDLPLRERCSHTVPEMDDHFHRQVALFMIKHPQEVYRMVQDVKRMNKSVDAIKDVLASWERKDIYNLIEDATSTSPAFG